MNVLSPLRRTAPANLGGAALLCALYVFLIYPAYALLSRSMRDENGAFAGPAHFFACLEEPGLSAALGHSLLMATVSTIFTVALAFLPAYAATHSRMPGRRICPVLALAPLCMPSMLPGIGIVYLFGAQGPLNRMLGGHDVYGPLGVVMGSVFFCLPHAVLLLRSSLERVDRRLYDAASGLGAGAWRRFFSVARSALRSCQRRPCQLHPYAYGLRRTQGTGRGLFHAVYGNLRSGHRAALPQKPSPGISSRPCTHNRT